MTRKRPQKAWKLQQLPPEFSRKFISQLANEFGLSEEIVKLLIYRGIADEQSINDFLSPSLHQLPRPRLMKGMEEAVAILLDGLKSGQPVSVFGDFDADGVTSTAVLSQFFTDLGMSTNYYIPDRLTEGYGLNMDAVRQILETNTRQWGKPGILVTVDCGISDEPVVDEARDLGFTVIITDHHKPPEKLPRADAVLNPLQPGCSFPCKHLAGVGVAFYLALGLRSELHKNGHWPEDKTPNLKSYMDLVAIGTVADQVPITGCNRIIVKAGLEVLNLRNRIGLLQLLDGSRDYGAEITAEDIAFRLAPRINAVGRIGSAQKAVELLSTQNPDYAKKLAEELEDANNARKKIEAVIFDEAVQMITPEILGSLHSLLLYKDNWHQGVLGIVASRLTDRYDRPAILLTDYSNTVSGTEQLVKGSGRSVSGIDIHQAVSACGQLLARFGGHEGAVGLTLAKENIDPFRQEFERSVVKLIKRRPESPELLIDLETHLELLTDKTFLNSYSLLAPYGSGNPAPVFCLKNIQPVTPRLVGSNHLRFTVGSGEKSINGIGFGFGSSISKCQNGPVDIAFTLRLNSYMGQEKWEINLVDIRPSRQ